MNEIIALNGGVLLNPSGIRKPLHVLTQGVGIRLDPVLSCMDPAGIEGTQHHATELQTYTLRVSHDHYSTNDNYTLFKCH